MAGPAGGPDEALAALGMLLADEAAAAVPTWTRAAVGRVLDAWLAAGRSLGPEAGSVDEVLERAEVAGHESAAAVADGLRTLAMLDVDAQRTTPLEVVRRAVVPGPTTVLAGAGVAPLQRDRFVAERFPDDAYGLTPPSLAALSPDLAELAIAWGAAKAAAHRARHRGPA